MDVGALRRVLKRTGQWRRLQDRVHDLPEHQAPIGRALTRAEQERLFQTAQTSTEWEHVHCAALVAANTSLRPVEVRHLRWQDVDLAAGTLAVRRSKNQSSHRVIPLNQSARRAFERLRGRATSLGIARPEHFIWPACRWHRLDAARPQQDWKAAWHSLRDAVGLSGLRFHDLRHTIITELAEMGVPDHVLESITGHLSRRMLEHHSHIRIAAKRSVLEALELRRAEELEALRVGA